MIPVTKTFMPSRDRYEQYLEGIWESGWITNNGMLATGLEENLEDYLDVPHVQLLSSGTMALQIALKVLKIKGEVITTPFSYVATTSSILWENCSPVFVDIDPESLTIDADKIEASITENTSAIMATHIYGIPCAVEKIAAIAEAHDLKVIYDAAHAFGVKIGGRPLVHYGDLSALSFHATKLFHTVEGGALVSKNEKLARKIFLSKTFGHEYNDHIQLGINGKNSEFHAAMGHCVLPEVEKLIEERKEISEAYAAHLQTEALQLPAIPDNVEHNYGYFPVVFYSEEILLETVEALEDEDIHSRRYFYPSLNELPYLEKRQECPVSSDISRRVLCLPLYAGLALRDVERISNFINKALKQKV
jgi:dTDP-4-amino-4,6-dideoxygalactose transaminase